MAYIRKIDALGGMLKAVELGFPQKEIAEAAYQFQLLVDSKENVIVGVNAYQDEVEQDIPTLQIDFAAEKNQIERTKTFKAKRDGVKLKAAVDRVRAACKENRNVMPDLIAAVEIGATLGEISDVYREIYGVYTDPGLL